MHNETSSKKIINKFSILLIVVLTLSICSVFSLSVHAENFNTNSYDVRIIVNKDNTFEYTETINTDFFNESHGIYRNIPMSNAYAIKGIKVEGHKYKVIKNQNGSNHLVIRIGSPEKYVYGQQKYVIKYIIQGYDQRGKDFLYLDLFPTSWSTVVDNLKIHVQFPKDFPLDELKKYSGGHASDDFQFGTMNIDNTNKTVDFYADNLPSNTGVTIGKNLPKGYWQGAKTKGYITSALLLIGIITIFVLRFTMGRNPRIVQTVEFNPPDDLSPIEIGYVVDGYVDKKDVSSCLFYLANKGYIKIRQNGSGRDDFEFEMTAHPTNEIKAQKLFFDGIFGKGASKGTISLGKIVDKEEIGTRLGDEVLKIIGAVESKFLRKNTVYSAASEKANTISNAIFFTMNFIVLFAFGVYAGLQTQDITALMVQIGIMTIVSGFMTYVVNKIVKIYYCRLSEKKVKTVLKFIGIGAIYLLASGIITYMTAAADFSINDPKVYFMYWLILIISPILMCGMRSRTKENANLVGRILGFKNFIATAELAKLEELVEEDPNYFYNILPYAYVFGLTRKWASKFDNIIKFEEPDWYVADSGFNSSSIFNAYLLSSLIDDVSTSMMKTINTTDSGDYSGSDSGFGGSGVAGGGGFSGGGFGGGGGGSW